MSGRTSYRTGSLSKRYLCRTILGPSERMWALMGGSATHLAGRWARMKSMDPRDIHAAQPRAVPGQQRDLDLDRLLALVARGDEAAFEAVYNQMLRDPAQSEEVTQEVLLEVWRTAPRFDPAKGSAATWVMTIAHRRAIDRIRSVTATTARDYRAAEPLLASDEVAEAVEASIDRERVRHCLDGLTQLQRESITLAYYGGYSYPQVAALLGATLSSIKTRIRDGLIRMRDCLGVSG